MEGLERLGYLFGERKKRDMVTNQRKYQIRMKEEGRCTRCGKVRDGKSPAHCMKCLAKRAAEYRNRQSRKKKAKKRLRRWDELGEVQKCVEEISGGKVLGIATDYNGTDYFSIEIEGRIYSYELIELLEKNGRGDLVDLVYEIIDDK